MGGDATVALPEGAGTSSAEPETRAESDAPQRAPGPEIGMTVGRYVLLEKVGEGGMGVVYRAYDPELSREVAIKLLTKERGAGRARARLLREAQALAQLTHPNVVPVYDVGEAGDDVFIVMEFIGGTTLRQWMIAVGRPWPEVVATLVQAGQGLAAAHAAGLVHRDFKPANVLIGEAGRVRVVDFGLARAIQGIVRSASGIGPPSRDPDASADELASSSMLSRNMTQAGVVVGTPSYMAPEQHRGAIADAKCDQFAFCVVLFEALYRQRPYRAGKLAELCRLKERREVVDVSREKPGVPRSVHAAVMRGLAGHPEDRWPDVAALLRALERSVARRRWRVWSGAAATTGLVAAAAVVLSGDGVAGHACPEAEPTQLWDERDQQRIRARFDASSAPYAPVAWDRLDGSMRTYAEQWAHERHEACAATRERHEQSDVRMDRRMGCYARALRTARGLVDALAAAPEDVLLRGPDGAAGLPALKRCREDVYLSGLGAGPDDEETRRVVQDLQLQIADGAARQLAGEFDAAVEIHTRVLARADALGYEPLRARARFSRGHALQGGGHFVEAEADLTTAYFDALGCGELPTAFDAASDLVWLHGEARSDLAQAKSWHKHADAVRRQAGLGDDERASLAGNYAASLHRGGELDEAVRQHRRALALLGRESDADRIQRGVFLNNLGNALADRGDADEAVEQHRRALEVWADVLGGAHPMIAAAHNNLGNSLMTAGRDGEARAELERALELRQAILPAGHPDIAASSNNLGSVYYDAEAYARALPLFVAAQRGFAEAYGPRHANVAVALENVGATHVQLGALVEAESALAESVEIRRELFGDVHPHTASALRWQGRLRSLQGRPQAAALLLERALAGFASGQIDPIHEAEARFDLARALWDVPARRSEAIGHAVAAIASFDARGTGARKQSAKARAWMKARSEQRDTDVAG